MTQVIFKTELEKINFLWNINLTQEEFDEIKKDNPNLMLSYSLQEKLFKNK